MQIIQRPTLSKYVLCSRSIINRYVNKNCIELPEVETELQEFFWVYSIKIKYVINKNINVLSVEL